MYVCAPARLQLDVSSPCVKVLLDLQGHVHLADFVGFGDWKGRDVVTDGIRMLPLNSRLRSLSRASLAHWHT